MKKRIAKDLLKQAINKIPYLKTLPPENAELGNWRTEVCRILEETFNRNSWEYSKFIYIIAFSMPKSDAEKKEAYNSYLDEKGKSLEEIIDRCKPWYEKLWPELRDFIATIIAIFLKQKTG